MGGRGSKLAHDGVNLQGDLPSDEYITEFIGLAKQEVGKLQERLKAAEARQAQLKEQLSATEQAKQAQTSGRETQEREALRLRYDRNGLRQNLQQLQERLAKAQLAAELAGEQAAAAEAARKQDKAKLRQLRAVAREQMHKVTQALQEVTAEAGQLREQAAKSQHTILTLTGDVEALASTCAAYEAQLDAVQAGPSAERHAALSAELEHHKASAAVLRGQVSGAQDAAAAAEARAAALAQQLAQAKTWRVHAYVSDLGASDPAFPLERVQTFVASTLLPAAAAAARAVQAAVAAGALPPDAAVRLGRPVLVAVSEVGPELQALAVQHRLFAWLKQHVWNSWTAGVVASLPPFAAKRATWEALSAVGPDPEGDLLEGVNRHLDGHRLAARHYFSRYVDQPQQLLQLLDQPLRALQAELGLLPVGGQGSPADALTAVLRQLLAAAVCGRLCVEAAHPALQLFCTPGVGSRYDAASMAAREPLLAPAPASPGSAASLRAGSAGGSPPMISAVIAGASEAGSSRGSDGVLRVLCCVRPGVRLDCPFISCITGCEQPRVVAKQEVRLTGNAAAHGASGNGSGSSASGHHHHGHH